MGINNRSANGCGESVASHAHITHIHSLIHGIITVFIKSCHCSQSWACWIQSTPSHPFSINIHFNIVPHLSHLPGGLFPTGFLTKALYALLISPIHVTGATHLTVLDLMIIIFVEEYKPWSSSLWKFLQLPIISTPSDPTIITSYRNYYNCKNNVSASLNKWFKANKIT